MIGKRLKKLAMTLFAVVLLMEFIGYAKGNEVHADSWVFGEEYYVFMKDGYHDYSFVLDERSHIHLYLVADTNALRVSIYNSSDEVTSSHREHTTYSFNAGMANYEYHHSTTLNAGSYYIHIDEPNNTGSYLLNGTAEPTVSLATPDITSVNNPDDGELAITTTRVQNSLGYEYAYSTNTRFLGATHKNYPLNRYTFTGLDMDTFYYVKARAYSTYSDGVKVFSNWSRPRLVFLDNPHNNVNINTGNKTYKYSAIKKAKKTFTVSVSRQEGARLKYSFVSPSSKVKKYISINKSTGKVTIKKKTPKGTYSVKVRVSAAATASYRATTVTKTIKIKIK